MPFHRGSTESGHQAHQGFLGKTIPGEFSGDFPFAHDDDSPRKGHDFREFGRNNDEAGAFASETIEEGVHLGFGSDIDAAGGFVNNENVTTRGQPFGEGDFLLISAAETGDGGVEGRGFDAELEDVVGNHRAFFDGVDETGAGQVGQRSEGGVFGAGHGENEALAFAVFGAKADAGFKGGIDGTELDFVAADADFAGGDGVEAENGGGDFAASGADEAGEAENFAGAQGEADVLEFAG